MFLHQKSRMCRNTVKCERNLCQFRHNNENDKLSDLEKVVKENYEEIIVKVDDMFACNKCNNKFQCNDTLEQHIKLTHTKEMYTCEFCDFESDQKEKLTMHIKASHELSCNMCDTKFVTQNGLDLHMNFKHHVEKIHENKLCCEWCKKNESKRVCIACTKSCCDPCVNGINKISKEAMDFALNRGIIKTA